MKPLDKFDYRVACDDFLIYELGRLIDEDKVSLDEPEFRTLIQAGIAEHVERRLDLRSEMALKLRQDAVPGSGRILHAIEDIESQLRDFPEIIQSYIAYLFERLEECASAEPDARITSAADVLLESPDDRASADAALDVLGGSPSAVSARVLAHAISEPMLPEDLENKAYNFVRSMWPLPRHYVLYALRAHTHEDIPFRWFQLLIDVEEPSAADRILEEVVVHGDDPTFREDLLALVALLSQARDPETEDKILQVLNTSDAPKTAAKMLEFFLKETPTRRNDTPKTGSWAALDRVYAANKKYAAAAKLFDAGKKAEAAGALDELLNEDPQYPFALMLKRLI
jgi:tetratricopeptide (TPR) repeat protein